MSTNTHRSRSKEQFWRRVIRQWDLGELSVRAFCRTHGLSEPSFYAWRRMLAQRDAQAKATPFVPVQVVAEPRSAEAPACAALELVLEGGRRLRIEPGFDGPTLRRVLTLLEEERP
jgi:transposase-like protein